MRRLKIGILDLLTNTPNEPWFQSHVMAPGFAAIMPQCIGVWAEELGHTVHYETFTGREAIDRCLPDELDLVFIACFSRSSFLAYGLSEQLRRKGVVTVLGGPHARSFPQHARQYFDYVCQLSNKDLIRSIFESCESHRPGVVLDCGAQPKTLPGVRARARFIDVGINKGTFLFRVVPMLGSLGCPYTCNFCVDAPLPYQMLPVDELIDDLKFAQERYGTNTLVGWHDPNFGVRFKDYKAVIERSGTKLMHVAESSLSLLGEANLKALKEANFVAMLPGIESWYGFAAKGGTKKLEGMEKVRAVADHLNRVQSYIPYVQANFVLGLDSDVGDEPWELTKRFVELSPGVFPGYSLMTDFQNAPVSAELFRAKRVLPVPYPLLDNNFAVNLTFKHYSPTDFYDRLIDLMKATWSWKALGRRFSSGAHWVVKVINFGRGLSEGRGRLKHHQFIRRRLDEDKDFLRFASGQGGLPPQFYFDAIRQQLGRFAGLVPSELLTPAGFVRSVESLGVDEKIVPAEKEAALQVA